MGSIGNKEKEEAEEGRPAGDGRVGSVQEMERERGRTHDKEPR